MKEIPLIGVFFNSMKVQKIFSGIYIIPLTILLGISGILSIFNSTYFELYMENEVPSYRQDNVLFMILGILVFVLISIWIFKRDILEKISWKSLYIGNLCYVLVLCIAFILIFHCEVACDAANVSDVSIRFLSNDYSSFQSGTYFSIFPSQLGFAAYLETIYRLVGVQNYWICQILNTICIVFSVSILHKITKEVFDNPVIEKWEIIFSFMLIPLYMYSTYIYGDIPALALGAAIVYYTIRYLKTNLPVFIWIVIGLFPFAIIIKKNNSIFLVAFCLILFLKFLQNRKWVFIVWIILSVFSVKMGTFGLEAYYMHRAQIEEFPKGTPMLAWIVMGMQEAKEENNGCGWYNGYNVNVYSQNSGNYDAMMDQCEADLKEAIQYRMENPHDSVKYYYKKFISTWNDPTFQAQINNEWYSRHVKPTTLWQYFNYEDGRILLFHCMNIFHSIILIFAFIGCLFVWGKWNLEKSFILLIVFGGMIFHWLVWEAKGRYVLPYYFILIPFAAAGIVQCYTIIKKMRQDNARNESDD